MSTLAATRIEGLSDREPAAARPRFAPDAEAVARAEAALQQLSGQFEGWLREEAAKLDAARKRLAAGAGAAGWCELHRRAHDLKGLAGTCGHPLVTRVCASLCRLVDEPGGPPPAALAEAHVEAVLTLLRARAEDAAASGDSLCVALETRAAAYAVARDPHG